MTARSKSIAHAIGIDRSLVDLQENSCFGFRADRNTVGIRWIEAFDGCRSIDDDIDAFIRFGLVEVFVPDLELEMHFY